MNIHIPESFEEYSYIKNINDKEILSLLNLAIKIKKINIFNNKQGKYQFNGHPPPHYTQTNQRPMQHCL